MTASLQEIRRQLREKFPQAHGGTTLREPAETPGERFFEEAAFPAGAISELIAAEGGALSLWIAGLLADPPEAVPLPKFVLVDGGNGFDPASYPAAACSQLLWVRCGNVAQALKAADLLVRDGNVPFVILDLCCLPVAALKAIPSSAWWRLKQLCEQGACRLVVLSHGPLVPCASLRLAISSSLALADFDLPHAQIIQRVTARLERRRQAN